LLSFPFRAAIEYQKKGPTENYEHGRVMENMLIVMAREMKKLRAEIASAEKRSCPPLEIQVYDCARDYYICCVEFKLIMF
jgi:hypothetical protein